MASPSNFVSVFSSIARNQASTPSVHHTDPTTHRNHLDGTGDQPIPTKRRGCISLTQVKRMARAHGSQLQQAVSDVPRARARGSQLQQAVSDVPRAKARGSQLQQANLDLGIVSGQPGHPLGHGLELQQAAYGFERVSLEPDHPWGKQPKVININVAIPSDLLQSPHTVINLNVCPANNNDPNLNSMGSTNLPSRSMRVNLESYQVNHGAAITLSAPSLEHKLPMDSQIPRGEFIYPQTNADRPTPSSSNGAPSTTDAMWGQTFDPVPWWHCLLALQKVRGGSWTKADCSKYGKHVQLRSRGGTVYWRCRKHVAAACKWPKIPKPSLLLSFEVSFISGGPDRNPKPHLLVVQVEPNAQGFD